MPLYNCTFFFEMNATGWTETYVQEAADEATAQAGLLRLVPTRMDLSPDIVKLKALRISQSGMPRDSILVPVPSTMTAGRFGDFNATGDNCDMPDLAMLVEYRNGSRYKNRKFLRGLPDVIAHNGELVWTNTAFNDAWLVFSARLSHASESWRVRTKNPAGGFQHQPITDVNRVRLTLRRVGRPFGLRVGRRKRRLAV